MSPTLISRRVTTTLTVRDQCHRRPSISLGVNMSEDNANYGEQSPEAYSLPASPSPTLAPFAHAASGIFTELPTATSHAEAESPSSSAIELRRRQVRQHLRTASGIHQYEPWIPSSDDGSLAEDFPDRSDPESPPPPYGQSAGPRYPLSVTAPAHLPSPLNLSTSPSTYYPRPIGPLNMNAAYQKPLDMRSRVVFDFKAFGDEIPHGRHPCLTSLGDGIGANSQRDTGRIPEAVRMAPYRGGPCGDCSMARGERENLVR